MAVETVPEAQTTVLPLLRRQYHLLIEAGEFEGQPIELLEGELVWVSPQGAPHSWAVESLTNEFVLRLGEAFGRQYRVRPQLPFAASDVCEPEPDIAIVDGDRAARGGDHPAAAHLVVEVTSSTHRDDLVRKARIYARAGLPLYWVVDLTNSVVVVHAQPGDDGYGEVERVPFDADLMVLGLTMRMSDLLA